MEGIRLEIREARKWLAAGADRDTEPDAQLACAALGGAHALIALVFAVQALDRTVSAAWDFVEYTVERVAPERPISVQ